PASVTILTSTPSRSPSCCHGFSNNGEARLLQQRTEARYGISSVKRHKCRAPKWCCDTQPDFTFPLRNDAGTFAELMLAFSHSAITVAELNMSRRYFRQKAERADKGRSFAQPSKGFSL